MNKNLLTHKYVFAGILISSMTLLPGCALVDWIKEKFGGTPRPTLEVDQSAMNNAAASKVVGVINDGSKPLVLINGAPVVTEKSFEAIKQELIESNPQFKEQIAMMGGESKCDQIILEGLARTAILNQHIADKKIDQKPEYKKDYERALRNIRDVLNAKYYAQELPVSVTDAEIRDFYEKNKDQVGIRQSTGGVKASGASFDSEKAAQDFLAKAKASNGDIKKAAKDANIAADKVQEFGLVHERSVGMNPALKEKILAITKFPTTTVIKVDDKTYWVVNASGKEAPKYTPLEQVRDNFKKYLEQEKLGKIFEEEINKLKEKYNVQIAGEQPQEKEEQDMQMVAPEEETIPERMPAKPTAKPAPAPRKEKPANTTKAA